MKNAVKRRRDPDETADIRKLIMSVVPDAEQWMDTPNPNLGGMKPADMIGTDKEIYVRNMVRAARLGQYS